MESDLQITVKGLPEDSANMIGNTVLAVVRTLERADEKLDLRRMHRIVVAKDFAGELAELSAATASGNPITHTDEEYAVAVAKVMALPSDEDYEIVPIVSADYAAELTLEDTEGSHSELLRMALHGLHHELCHVHDNNKLIDAFGTLLLRHCCSGKDIYIRPLAEACWSEYIADFLSSSTADTASLAAMTKDLGDVIARTKSHIDNEIWPIVIMVIWFGC
jgi:hypothetical protein